MRRYLVRYDLFISYIYESCDSQTSTKKVVMTASTLLQNATATLLQTTLVQNGKRVKKCDIYYKIRKCMYCAEVA